MLSCLWDGAYKRTLVPNQKEYPMWQQHVSMLLYEWSFTTCPMPYNRRMYVLSASLNKTFACFLPSLQVAILVVRG